MLASQRVSSKHTRMKNNSFPDLLLAIKKTKSSYISFSEFHCFIDRVGALTNEQEKYEDFYILS